MPPKQKLSSSQKKRKNVGRRAKAANVKRLALESAAALNDPPSAALERFNAEGAIEDAHESDEDSPAGTAFRPTHYTSVS